MSDSFNLPYFQECLRDVLFDCGTLQEYIDSCSFLEVELSHDTTLGEIKVKSFDLKLMTYESEAAVISKDNPSSFLIQLGQIFDNEFENEENEFIALNKLNDIENELDDIINNIEKCILDYYFKNIYVYNNVFLNFEVDFYSQIDEIDINNDAPDKLSANKKMLQSEILYSIFTGKKHISTPSERYTSHFYHAIHKKREELSVDALFILYDFQIESIRTERSFDSRFGYVLKITIDFIHKTENKPFSLSSFILNNSQTSFKDNSYHSFNEYNDFFQKGVELSEMFSFDENDLYIIDDILKSLTSEPFEMETEILYSNKNNSNDPRQYSLGSRVVRSFDVDGETIFELENGQKLKML